MDERRIGLHWFRRDLRVAGNPGLQKNFARNAGRVLGVFFFDSKFLSRSDFSPNRFAFFLKTLKALKEELESLGGDLLVLDRMPVDGFDLLLEKFKAAKLEISLVSWNRDYEPFARNRDKKVQKNLEAKGIPIEDLRDHLILEPEEVFKDAPGDFYKVYSPFARKWYEIVKSDEKFKRIQSQDKALSYLEDRLSGKSPGQIFTAKWSEVFGVKTREFDRLEEFIKANEKRVTIPIPEAGSLVAFRRIKKFAANVSDYGSQRDLPDVDGTSKLSVFLKNGSITTAMIAHFLNLETNSLKSSSGPNKFLKELVWREFYYHILYHCPRVESEAFNEKYKSIAWQNDETLLAKWKAGETGYPIVDAGMRQLNQTGWMHNRVRMIVASFLTKDLLIDYRHGEQYFMEKLLDGDMAPNNGGWQWSASTGVDAQPYFRIFNPRLQSERFDPEGHYIKTYVPELRSLSSKVIHAPDQVKGYPQPIVDHFTQKEKAIKLFSN